VLLKLDFREPGGKILTERGQWGRGKNFWTPEKKKLDSKKMKGDGKEEDNRNCCKVVRACKRTKLDDST